MTLKMTMDELQAFNESVFPQVRGQFTILDLEPNQITVRMNINEGHLRPGGTVSGPSMFSLADCCFYMVTMAMIGPESLTVTTNLSIDFMRKPEPTNLIGKGEILKLGKTLSVGHVTIFSEGSDKAVAHANVTYAIPPKRS